MEHPLTDLGSQAAPHLSATFVETASESDTVGAQEREGDIEEPGIPGGSKVRVNEGSSTSPSRAGHEQCCILSGVRVGQRCRGPWQLSTKQHQLGGFFEWHEAACRRCKAGQ